MTTAPYRRLAVIGDVHAEHERLARTLTFIEQLGVDHVVCTGDIADGTGSVDACCDLLARDGVTTVRGNHDRWMLEDRVRHVPGAHLRADLAADSVTWLEQLPIQVDIETVDGQLLLCHGMRNNDLAKIWPGSERMPPERSKALDSLIQDDTHSYVINGHMHYRTLISFERLRLLNAGTLKGEHRPGFSVIDFEAREVTAYAVDPDAISAIVSIELGNDIPHQGVAKTVWRDTQHFDASWTPVVLY